MLSFSKHMLFSGDQAIVSFLQSMALSSSVATWLAIFAARYLIFVLLLAIPLLWKKGKQGKHAISELLWAGGVSILTTTLISHLIARPRPFTVSGNGILHLIPEPFNFSFPSGHTAVAFTVAAILLSFDRRLGSMAFAIAILVALGRVAVGVHYPSDIFGGMLVAAVVFVLIKFIHRQIWEKSRTL